MSFHGMRSRRIACAVVLAGCLTALTIAASAQAANGTWDRTWGKNVSMSGGTGFFEVCTLAADCQAGSDVTALGGELDFPEALATDSAGNVYVADSSNHRIQKFDAFGNFQLAWGKDVSIGSGTGALEVCTVASDCKQGETNTAAGGELNFPEGIATDSAGNVYVGDTSNHRIQKFDGFGNFQRAWGKNVSISDMSGNLEVCTVAIDCQVGSTTTAAGGEMSDPQGVAVGPSGVYVADEGRHRIQLFTPNGAFVLTWGEDVLSTGGAGFEICGVAASCKTGVATGIAFGGELEDPFDVAVDPAGNVLVSDASHDRMQRFDSAGNFQLAWGGDVVSAGPGNTGGFEICVAANGDTCQTGSAASEVGGILNFPQGVDTDASGAIYVGDSQFNRIQKYGAALNFISAWGMDVIMGAPTGYEICVTAAVCQEGTSPPTSAFGGELNFPTGVATDAAGNLYVADSSFNRIQRFADPPATPVTPTPPPTVLTTAPTGQRAAALKKCKKKRSKQARKKCRKKANKLPV